MTVDLANQIVAKRTLDPTVAGPAHRYETWILTEGIVPLATMKTMMPFVNAGGSVYRVQSIGHFEEGGATPTWKSCSTLANGPPTYYCGEM